MSTFRAFTFDAKRKSSKPFKANAAAETEFYRALKKVAKASGALVESHISGTTILAEKEMVRRLKEYSEAIGPWAIRQCAKLLSSVSKKNQKAYEEKSKLMGKELRAGMAENDVHSITQALMKEQVALIKSIPIEAGARAQKLSIEAVYNGSRASDIAEELMKTTDVTESRALLIARTETARANASFTQARANSIGATKYIWHTTMDGAERESHRKMNGKVIEYAKAPTLIDGMTGHAGTFPNCRCWQEPIFE